MSKIPSISAIVAIPCLVSSHVTRSFYTISSFLRKREFTITLVATSPGFLPTQE